MLPENFESELKSEIRYQIAEYYDQLKYEIDLYTEKCLLNPPEGIDQDKVHDLNEKFITIINDCSQTNLFEVEKFFQENKSKLNDLSFYEVFDYSEKKFTRTILSKHCFYVPKDLLKWKEDNILGVVVQSDWHLNSTEKNFIRKSLEEFDHLTNNELELIQNLSTMHFSYKTKPPNVIELKKNVISKEISNLSSLNLKNYSIFHINSKAFAQFTNLHELNLSSNSFKSLNVGIFEGLNNLKVLQLVDCQLKLINPKCFAPLKNLESLNLSRNKLTVINNELLNYLKNIEKLSLKSCSIKNIERNTFVDSKRLKELDLTDNPLTIIYEGIFNGLSLLETLNLTRCTDIHAIDPKAFVNTKNLKEVDLPIVFESLIVSSSNILFPSMELLSLEMC